MNKTAQLGMTLLTALTLAACGKADAPAANNPSPSPMAVINADVAISVTDTVCEPNALTVPAGKTTFVINNKSTKPLEWEILKGVMIVDERENIAPSFTAKLTATLEAGEYEITCGLLTNPRGKLTVTPNGAVAPTNTASVEQLAAPIAEYKKYVLSETASLVQQTELFVAAFNAGDIKKAQTLYAPTRAHYERIEPIAELFADLDGAIDARADAYKKQEARCQIHWFSPLRIRVVVAKNRQGLEADC